MIVVATSLSNQRPSFHKEQFFFMFSLNGVSVPLMDLPVCLGMLWTKTLLVHPRKEGTPETFEMVDAAGFWRDRALLCSYIMSLCLCLR